MKETIFALSSGAGRAGVAVIRLSGPAAGTALRNLTGAIPPARRARLAQLRSARDGALLDEGLVLWFPGPDSFTGEDVAELHIHGGAAVIAALLDELSRQEGFRLAQPGEFTRRAFAAGKMDLTEAEGLIDLIDAETEAQRRQALRQSTGELGRLYDSWRERLIVLLAHYEAAIDFPDEELPDDLDSTVSVKIQGMVSELTQHLDDNRRGERLRDGVYIAILGPPNAGKSSLLNLLSRRDAAIVSAEAGTTRDIIEVRMDLSGYPVTLADTAGLRASADLIEREGVRRATLRAGQSDLQLAVFDSSLEDPGYDSDVISGLIGEDTIVVCNKTDLTDKGFSMPDCRVVEPALGVCRVSVVTGDGIDELLETLTRAVSDRIGQINAPVITRTRHRMAIEECRSALQRSLSASESALAAEDIRLAMRELGRITGAVDVEDLLDVIFRDFCIGK